MYTAEYRISNEKKNKIQTHEAIIIISVVVTRRFCIVNNASEISKTALNFVSCGPPLDMTYTAVRGLRLICFAISNISMHFTHSP